MICIQVFLHWQETSESTPSSDLQRISVIYVESYVIVSLEDLPITNSNPSSTNGLDWTRWRYLILLTSKDKHQVIWKNILRDTSTPLDFLKLLNLNKPCPTISPGRFYHIFLRASSPALLNPPWTTGDRRTRGEYPTRGRTNKKLTSTLVIRTSLSFDLANI